MPEDNSREMEESFEKMLAEHDSQRSSLEKGQKISGVIISINGDTVFIDLGLKEDGLMDIQDLPDKADGVKAGPGDRVEGFITDISSQGIRIARSMSGAGIAALEDAKEAGIPVEGRVKGPCKGGYQVEIFGKTAFCPGSQMEAGLTEEELSGKVLQFLVTRIENNGRNIVVSRRALLDRERKENLEKILATVHPGDIIDGKVSRLTPFGAFIELAPGVEGLAHVSELCWSRINTPEEALSKGDNVRVKVLDITEDEKKHTRISLSCKQAIQDPWTTASNQFKAGDVVSGKVVRFAPFGAFVEIIPGIDGLIHLSEMSWEKRINKPEEALELNQSVQVKIKEVNPDSRRISLSLKDAIGDPWEMLPEKLTKDAVVTGRVESRSPHGLFISLYPGITGLLPASAIKNSPLAQKLNKLESGSEIEVKIQNIDSASRRISLVPASENKEEKESDASWKSHMQTGNANKDSTLMAAAFQKALQRKGDHKK